jgi:hypothetical protein
MNLRLRGLMWYPFYAAAILVPTLAISTAAESGKQSATNAQQTKLDSLSGFRGQKFGTPLSEFQGLSLDKDKGDIKLYVKKDENLVLGPVKLETIVYHFYQDKFYAVSLHTQERDDTLSLLRVSLLAFGAGNQRPNARDELDQSWLGKNAEAFFNVNPRTDEGSLFIRDNQLSAEVEAYREKIAQEAASEL